MNLSVLERRKIFQLTQKYVLTKKERDDKLQQVMSVLQNCSNREYHAILKAAAYERPWRPRREGWTNVFDQFLHAAYGAILVLPILLLDSYLGAAIMGLLAGGIREIEQYFNQDLRIRMFWDRVIDTSAFVIGAIIIFCLLH